MKLVFDNDYSAAIAEVPNGKVLVITDRQGNEIHLGMTNENAQIISEGLNPSTLVIPKGNDVMKLIKSH